MNLSTNVPQAEERSPLDEFSERHGLSPFVEMGSQLATEYFDTVSPVAARRVEDAESGEEWIELGVRVRGNVASVRAAHRQYTRAWLKLVPIEKTLLIRLAISIAKGI